VPTDPASAAAPARAAEPTVRGWTLWSAEGDVEVEVRCPEGGVLGDVLETLAGELHLPTVQLWSGSAALPADTPLTAEVVCHGAVLGLGRPGPRGASLTASGAVEVYVTAGPDAGRTMPLGQGTLVVGRSASCGLHLADPDVSRRHVLVSVAEGRVTVADLGSSNGTSLSAPGRGTPAQVGAHPREWPVGATLRLGSSVLRLSGPRGAPLRHAPQGGGRRLLRPVGATSAGPAAVVVRLPVPPTENPRRRLGWVAVGLPAAGGLLMAWLLSTPQFLFFALLSPLVAIGSWASDRVTGRRTFRRAVADHALACALAEAEVDAAVATDLAVREDQQPDPAALAAAARRRAGPLWSRPVGAAGLAVRLGNGPGPTAVTTSGPDGTRSAVIAEHLPVPLDLANCGSLGIVGPRGSALGVARSIACQLAVLTPPAQLRFVLVCSREQAAEWRWARWLPQLHAVLLPGDAPGPLLDAVASSPAGPTPTTVVLLDGPLEPGIAEILARADGRTIRLDIAESEASLAMPVAALVQVTGETGTSGRLRVPGPDADRLLTLDAVSDRAAAGIARDLAPLTVPASSGDLPDATRLLDLPAAGLTLRDSQDLAGEWDHDRRRLTAVLGTTGRDVLRVDLVADGPHALIAGTTGSGKSELLQTLVASLALHHPPDRCSFLLVDYKGGAAFGEAAALPHTVGVLTDLDHQSTARALRSLSAELARRERLLADHGARDLGDLPPGVRAARLLIVVDEFATLAEELPGFVSGLVGIAQRGRSLGVHLVLATQRPAGVVSPEIRANCSLRICLRTTDEGDARDVLGSTLPAQLSPDRPGRAYVRRGSTAPVLVQVARVSGRSSRTGAAVVVSRRPWPPAAPGPAHTPVDVSGSTDLERLVAALADRARADEARPPDRPWLPPLPDGLSAADLDSWADGDQPTRLRIGLLDSPDAQLQEPLELDLATGGGWLLVGGPRSGRTTALRTVLTEGVRRLPPARLHVHVLDHGGGSLARDAAALPHCGTAVAGDDAHRSVRLLARLGEEVDRRRGGGAERGQPLLLVLVDGYESLVAQLEDADPATGAAGLLRLVRDGAAVGVTVALAAERAIPGSRVAGAAHRRIVLPLPDRADYAVAGVPARSVPGHRPPGRALVGEDAVECQLALPRAHLEPLPDLPGTAAAVPIRVATLDPDPELPLPGPSRPSSTVGVELALGPGGDEGTVVAINVQRAGGLLVVGPPGSGRSSALSAFAEHCSAAGAAVAVLAAVPAPCPATAATAEAPAVDGPHPWDRQQLGRQDAEGLRRWLLAQTAARPVVVVADDLMSLPDAVADLLTSPAGAGTAPIVLGSGAAADLAASFRGPAVALRRSRSALFLRPGPGDAELLGLRTPRTPLPPRPGAGWLVTPAQVVRVQVARRRRPAGVAP
jgi:S-DNA-T family DNA segregation ATPase FtsK/SpoIIIE